MEERLEDTPAPDYAIFVLDDAFDTGVAALLDTFGIANDLAEKAGCPEVRFNVEMVGVRSRIVTARGFRAAPIRVGPQSPAPRHVLIPATGAQTPEALEQIAGRPDIVEAQRVFQAWANAGSTIAAACTGTFLAAGSGVLDGHRVTTAWWLAPTFRQRFSGIRLEEASMVIDDGAVITAGAAFGHVDLALALIRKRSPALASMTARYLLIDDRPSQSAFAIPDHLQHTDSLVAAFEQWIRAHIGEPLSMETAARAVGTSPRSLERRVRDALGCSPIRFVQALRVEVAVHRLQTTDDNLVEIASAVGYQEAATLRRLIRRRLGKSVRDFRRPAAV